MVVSAKEDTTKVDMVVANRAVVMEAKEVIIKEVAMVVAVEDMVREVMTRARVVDMANLKAGVVDTVRASPSSSGEVKVNLLAILAHMIRAMVEAPQEVHLDMDSLKGLPHMEVVARVDMVEQVRVAMAVARDTNMFDRAPSNLGRGNMNVGPRTSVADIGLLGQVLQT